MTTKERDSYSVAEEEAARALCAAIEAEPRRTFFIGHTAGNAFCATFQFDDVPRDLGIQFATSRQLRLVAINASLRITANVRGHVAQALTAILAASPFIDEPGEALQSLRIREDGFPAIEPVTVTNSDGDIFSAWQAEVGFSTVFRVR